MKRNYSWWVAFAVLAPAALGGSLAGWHAATAGPPPPCVTCNCKDVIRWQDSSSAYRGSKAPGTAIDTLHAFLGILSSGGCKNAGAATSGTYDRWTFTTCSPVCAVGGASELEVTCTDTGALDSADHTRRQCN